MCAIHVQRLSDEMKNTEEIIVTEFDWAQIDTLSGISIILICVSHAHFTASDHHKQLIVIGF